VTTAEAAVGQDALPVVLAEERPVTFVVICPACGEVLCGIPVEPGETWYPATCWAYVEQKRHDQVCQPPLSAEW
jgi:hypothetical protein